MTTQQLDQLTAIIDQLEDLSAAVSDSEWAFIMDATAILADLRDATIEGTVEEELMKF